MALFDEFGKLFDVDVQGNVGSQWILLTIVVFQKGLSLKFSIGTLFHFPMIIVILCVILGHQEEFARVRLLLLSDP